MFSINDNYTFFKEDINVSQEDFWKILDNLYIYDVDIILESLSKFKFYKSHASVYVYITPRIYQIAIGNGLVIFKYKLSTDEDHIKSCIFEKFIVHTSPSMLK